MTFYNIIFAILFFGASRELFVSIVERNWLKFFMALSLAICVFNDTLYTSHYIEKDAEVYNVKMKLLDLLNFLVLGISLVILSPRNNVFYDGSDVPGVTISEPPAWCFWGLLVIYWIIARCWNRLAERPQKTNSQESTWVSTWPFLTIVIVTLLAFIASLTPWPSLQLYTSSYCAATLLAYMTIYKLMVERRDKEAKRLRDIPN
jgi:hypothetical protein